MTGNIWIGSQVIPSTANADNTILGQRYIATEGQTVFLLTVFAYAPGTGSLSVFVNGADQFITQDYLETDSGTVTFTSGLELGDVVVIRGLVGGTAAQAAQVSAAQAAASATAASGYAVQSQGYAAQSLTYAGQSLAAYNAILALNLPALPLTIPNGGTGQITAIAAFAALAPAAPNAGDILYYNGTNWTKLPIGTNNFVLTVDTSLGNKLKYAPPSGSINNFSAITGNSTLTAGNIGEHNVQMTGPGLSVTLPDATTMVSIGVKAVFHNAGSYTFAIRDNGGNLIRAIEPNGSAVVSLESIGIANGPWNISGTGVTPIFWQQINTVLGAGNSHTSEAVISLSATLAVYITSFGGSFFATAHDLAGNTIGAPVSLGANGVNSIITGGAAALDSTHGVVAGGTNVTVFSVAGTVVTAGGTQASIGSTSPNLTVLSPTLFTMQALVGANIQALATTVAGVTQTQGIATTIASSASMGLPTGSHCYVRGTTQVFGVVEDLNANVGKIFLYTVAGVVITPNQVVSFNHTVSAGYSDIVNMATDEYWLFSCDSVPNIYVIKFVLTATTITLTTGTGPLSPAAASGAINVLGPVRKVSATQIAMYLESNGPIPGDYIIGTLTGVARCLLTGATANDLNTLYAKAISANNFPNVFTPYSLQTKSTSGTTLIAIDESFTNNRAIVRAGFPAATDIERPQVIRFAAKDIILGYHSFTNTGVIPGVMLMLDRNDIRGYYQEYKMPLVSAITYSLFHLKIAVIGTNKAAIMSDYGIISTFELAAA